CEIGAGMMNSYHRRIFVYPMDAESTTLVKLGSGSTSPGYYMYHGGVNPEGRLTTLQESQATGYWNDMPVKNYDFQTALGEYGQVRPQYHSLRRLHLFLRDFGARIANMPAAMPDRRPNGRDDVETLRWSVRSDGRSGFVFVNNYERLRDLPAKEGVQFRVILPGGALLFPETPVRVPANECFFWPFRFDLGGVELEWATAQPLAAIDEENARTVFFAETPGVPVEIGFAEAVAPNVRVKSGRSGTAREGMLVVRNIKPSRDSAIEIRTDAGRVVRIVVLSDEDSLALWKGEWMGRERVFVTSASLVIDTNALRLTSEERRGFDLAMLPAPEALAVGDARLRGRADGVFSRFAVPAPEAFRGSARTEKVKSAGAPREIPLGKISQPVAAAPEDEDFEQAAVWRIRVPRDLDLSVDPLLRLEYVGDVARVRLNGRLVTDDFYNGKPWEIGLRRHAPEILTGNLEVAILPLRKDAPIYMADHAKPRFGKESSVAELRRVEIVPRYRVELTVAR
ncbi:MAG TPA: beta-galactosidase, partial [Verrucomicrobiota bacterium]|nr:beta-galactosidase [Verrucomicrobiota bacterium]